MSDLDITHPVVALCPCGRRKGTIVQARVYHERTCAEYAPMLSITGPDNVWRVDVHAEGDVEYHGAVDPTAAARQLWDALGQLAEVAYQQGRTDERAGR